MAVPAYKTVIIRYGDQAKMIRVPADRINKNNKVVLTESEIRELWDIPGNLPLFAHSSKRKCEIAGYKKPTFWSLIINCIRKLFR